MAQEWRVTAQRQTDILTPQGTFETSMEVTFEVLPEGITGQVTVPLRLYTEDYVRDLIQARTDAIKAVARL
jgi:hypothetical protein